MSFFKLKRVKFDLIALIIAFLLSACAPIIPRLYETSLQSTSDLVEPTTDTRAVSLINTGGNTIEERILLPEGYERLKAPQNSFAQYLRTLALKPHGSKIKLYNGETRESGHCAAILDIDVGERDLQQCADAVMRLRAEYLYSQKLYNKIHFNFTNGFKADYDTWMKGGRIEVKGNKAYWTKTAASSESYSSFRKYLNMVFSYAGTLSLSQEMIKADINEMMPGDVFIKGAIPGHAVIVLDVAVNEAGDKIFMLAQSFMPAQDIHILENFENKEISPWYQSDFGEVLHTPDWQFEKNQLMRFAD